MALSRETHHAFTSLRVSIRAILRPRLGHEKRFSFFVPIVEWLSDTERGQARFSDRETNRGHGEKKMNKEMTPTSHESGEATAKPTKLWLWCLATIQLLAVVFMSRVGVEDSVIKASGFGILFLCSLMDIKAMKAAGYNVPRWWWGIAIFLPPIYLVMRVLKTDTAPAQRFSRFAPAFVWIFLFAVYVIAVMLVTSGSSPYKSNLLGFPSNASDKKVDLTNTATKMIDEMLTKQFKQIGLDSYIRICFISNVYLVKEGKDSNLYKGLADVKMQAIKGDYTAFATIQYDLSGTFDGEQLLLEIRRSDSSDEKFGELLQKAGYQE